MKPAASVCALPGSDQAFFVHLLPLDSVRCSLFAVLCQINLEEIIHDDTVSTAYILLAHRGDF